MSASAQRSPARLRATAQPRRPPRRWLQRSSRRWQACCGTTCRLDPRDWRAGGTFRSKSWAVRWLPAANPHHHRDIERAGRKADQGVVADDDRRDCRQDQPAGRLNATIEAARAGRGWSAMGFAVGSGGQRSSNSPPRPRGPRPRSAAKASAECVRRPACFEPAAVGRDRDDDRRNQGRRLANRIATAVEGQGVASAEILCPSERE